MANEIPAEITELRDLRDTAQGNRDAADAAVREALMDLRIAQDSLTRARNELDKADRAEVDAGAAYLAALRRHGYVQTADGPRPAVEGTDYITVTPSPEMRAAVLAAAGLEDQAPKGDDAR